jgi:tRNA-splicing ligase RtcB
VNRGLDGLASVLPRIGLISDAYAGAAQGVPVELFEEDRERTEDRGVLDGSLDALPEEAVQKGLEQLGTLGGGNHFVEIQQVAEVADERRAEALGLRCGQITCMIHSGSRGLGYQVAASYMRQAKAHLESRSITPPNGQLLYFPAGSAEGALYLKAMNGAANFAFANREIMALLIRRAFDRLFGRQTASAIHSVYDITHNMAKEEELEARRYFVHRKGATRAFDAERMQGTPFEKWGQPVLIPGSMGTSSYVLLGHPGSRMSFFSVNHGAGRVMSRTEAAGRRGKKRGKKGMKGKKERPAVRAAISDKDFERSMEGIFLICEDRRRIKEEAPAAYKDIDEVIRVVLGADLALPVARLSPLAVLKG